VIKGKFFAPAKLVVISISLFCLASLAPAANVSTHLPQTKSKTRKVTETPTARRHMQHLAHSRVVNASAHHRYYYGGYYHTSSYATDVTTGDVTTGEDLIVRQAAIDALGNMNGSVVAIEPTSGRILAMVNQKMILSSGAQPCSTIKLSVALAALSEGIITKETEVRLGGHYSMNLTNALAHSNNQYFEALGRQLGFERVAYYAHQYGLGELAGYDIPGESAGIYPQEVISDKLGGVGKMCSFGEGVSMTPLQLGALVSAIANGGTLYYLQHPRSAQEIANFEPQIKRHLDIAPLIPEISDGMAGAVDFGTARSVHASFTEEDVLGKTGTCSRDGTRFGWFGSYAKTNVGHIVVVVFLEGGKATFGPKAAEVAGHVYRNLYDHDFFTVKPATAAGLKPVTTSN
jgi:penicillin-binding protein 2